MAYVRCKACRYQLYTGFMPASTCGLLILPALLITLAVSVLAWRIWGWWSLIVPVPMIFLALLAVHFVPWTIEYLMICWRRCPECGERRWSYPFTQGFGL